MTARSGAVAEDLVTRREASELAGVHLNTVRLWESTGRVTTSKSENGVVMIPRSEILAIMEHRQSSDVTEREKNASLEAENRMLREELELTRAQYAQLLERVITIAGGAKQ